MSRSLWKSQYVNKNFLKNEESMITVFNRSQTIISEYIGLKVQVYNGIRFYKIESINYKMVGHKFGEFSPTRKIPNHKKKNAILKKKVVKKKKNKFVLWVIKYIL